MDSANYGFQKRFADVKPVRREPDHSRRESKVISDMKYNIQRTESVYKMVTAEPFTKKLTKIDITHLHGKKHPSCTQNRVLPTHQRVPDALRWRSRLALGVGEGQKLTRCIVACAETGRCQMRRK
jgi:hypothetical protein